LRVHNPSGLVAQQRKQWDPLLQWMRDRYACELTTTFEIETPTQSDDAIAKQHALLASLSGWQLAALDSLTTVTKSFVISWALLTDRITITQAFEAARLEENFQMRQYGQVEGVYGHGIEMEFTRMSMAAAKTWVNCVTTDPNENPLLQPHTTIKQ
jgi:ATP synthase F1 complex assembly factor 2